MWWSSAFSSASSAGAPTRRLYDEPPPPPPPPPSPPLPPLPPELQLGPTPAYGTKGGGGVEAAAAESAAVARALRRGAKPHVVLMNVDDTGYGDYGFNNPATDDTPHLDKVRVRVRVG